MTYTLEQIATIIKTNPNKKLVQIAQNQNQKLSLHLNGTGLDSAIKKSYYEKKDSHAERQRCAISNKDVFKRILNEENQVFTAMGGSVNYYLSDSDEKQMNILTSNVQYGINLHDWIRVFALPAYRSDPMGLIFMESAQTLEIDDDPTVTPACYPTYKSSKDIYDYLPNGRSLEYICFKISKEQLPDYGIYFPANTDLSGYPANYSTGTGYFRFVDDSQDILLKKDGDKVMLVLNTTQKNPIVNTWGKVPAFIISDIVRFDNPKCFESPVSDIMELADMFFNDRSIRELQKKLHGFAKAIEPALGCPTCGGEGLIGANPCPSCTLPGQERGTGIKLQSTPSDVAKFDIQILDKLPSFDFKKVFGYVQPPIETWDKQDASLEATEDLMYQIYWGAANAKMLGFNGSNKEESATKTIVDQQSKYARLNLTANWAEQCECAIANFIGLFWFDVSWKGANITYGRNFILETADEVMVRYQEFKSKGLCDTLLDQQLEKFIHVKNCSSPVNLAIYLKLLKVEPFIHKSVEQVEASQIVGILDKLCKRFYSEWVDTVPDALILKSKVEDLRAMLIEYATPKMELVNIVEADAITQVSRQTI